MPWCLQPPCWWVAEDKSFQKGVIMQFVWRVHLAWLIHPLQHLFCERRGTLKQLVLHGFIFRLSLPCLTTHGGSEIIGLFFGWWWRSQSPQSLRGCPIRGSSVGFRSSPRESSAQHWAILVPCRVPPLREQPEVLWIFCFPLPSTLLYSASWHWIQRQISSFFPDTSKQNPAFSGNDTLSHTWFLENTNLSAPASDYLYTQSLFFS